MQISRDDSNFAIILTWLHNKFFTRIAHLGLRPASKYVDSIVTRCNVHHLPISKIPTFLFSAKISQQFSSP